MFRRKEYGNYRVDECPFCGKRAVTENSQGVPVCKDHKASKMEGMKCVCGEWLDIKKGKYGSYFNCINCGNISWRKGIEMNTGVKNQNKNKPEVKSEPELKEKKEIVITSRECDAYYS